MIQHHDVAVEMAERIMKNSKNPALISFAYDTIANQRYEIWTMRQLLQSKKIHSPILENFIDKSYYTYVTHYILLLIVIGLICLYIKSSIK